VCVGVLVRRARAWRGAQQGMAYIEDASAQRACGKGAGSVRACAHACSVAVLTRAAVACGASATRALPNLI